MIRSRFILLATIFFLSACATRPVPPERLAQLQASYQEIETILAADRGELERTIIGSVSVAGSEQPIQLITRRSLVEDSPHILILAEPATDQQLSSEIVMETIRQLVKMPSLYGNAHVDLVPLAAPRAWLEGGRAKLVERKVIRRYLKDHKYDLVILHRTESDLVGFSIVQIGDLGDEAAFALSRVRDNGYFIREDGKKSLPDHGLASDLSDIKPGSLMVFSTWRGEEKEKAIFQHLIAQETVTRLLMKNFYH